MNKFVYSFNEGNKDMRSLLGGKGANLCEMTKLGLPVPKGFIVTTEACTDYFNNNKSFLEATIRNCVAIYMSNSASSKNGIIRKAIEKVFAEMEEENDQG